MRISEYTRGSEALKIDIYKEQYKKTVKKINQIKQDIDIEKKIKVKRNIVSEIAVLISIISILIISSTCITYVSSSSNINYINKEIIKLKREINQREIDYKIKKAGLENKISLKKVYKIASKKLGMKIASKEQVFTYKDNQSDFIKQYQEFPVK